MVNLKDYKHYHKNPRKISDEQKKHLGESLKKYGDINGIVLNKTSGEIISGNQRSDFFLSRLNDCTIEIIKEYDTPTTTGTISQGYIHLDGESFNLRVVEWDQETEELANLEANKAGGEWDASILMSKFEESTLLLAGFSSNELSEFTSELPDIERETDGDDDIPDQVPPVTVLGDLYELGGHRVLCGDCTVIRDVERLMGGVKADQLITDPPYNVDYTGKTKEALTIDNDSMSDDDFRVFLVEALKLADIHMKPGAVFYIWHADSEGHNFRGACHDIDWKVRQCLIWIKDTLVMGRQDYHWRHEPCLYGGSHLWASDRTQTTILQFARQKVNDIHPTMKPVDLITYQIKNNTKSDQIVLDLFLGSGTTLIACEKTNRICFGMELDEKYCDVIVKRYIEFCENNNIPIEIKRNGKPFDKKLFSVLR